MNAKLGRRMRFVWQTSRFFSRMLIEHVASGWLLGIAPFLAHLGAAVSRTDYRWIPADVYLFVMMIGGGVAIDAFKDRRSDGPIRPLAGMLGSLVAAGAAWCYGSLETDIPALHDFLRANFRWP
ncbi:MAG TPA: hypothetical protein VGD09_17475 [Blastococcus sp.]